MIVSKFDDGKPLDTTSSGYDYSLVLALIKKGVKHEDLLANALWNRSDEAAQAKGRDYIRRTVRRALERFQERREQEEADLIDFNVERVRIFDSDPAVYEFTIEGVTFQIKSSALKSPGAFSTRFMDALHRIPVVPEAGDWAKIVNGWLHVAERVKQPPEASDEIALRDAVSRAVVNFVVGEDVEDLDRGKALELAAGALAFKVEPMLTKVKEQFPRLDRSNLCRVLKDLGFESKPRNFGGEHARAWAKVDSP